MNTSHDYFKKFYGNIGEMSCVVVLSLLNEVLFLSRYICSDRIQNEVHRKLSELKRYDRFTRKKIAAIVKFLSNSKIDEQLNDLKLFSYESVDECETSQRESEWCLSYNLQRVHLPILGSEIDTLKIHLITKASMDGDYDTLKVLLDTNMSVDTTNKNGETLLMLGSASGHTQIVAALIEKCASVNKTSNEKCSAVYFCVKNGHISALQLLIDAGADLHALQGPNRLPLISFANPNSEGRIEKMLIDRSPTFGELNDEIVVTKGRCKSPCAEECSDFIDYIFSPNASPRKTENPRHPFSITKIVLGETLKFNFLTFEERDHCGRTPLIRAVIEGDFEGCKALVRQGVDVNSASNIGRNSLTYAVFGGSIELLDFLLSQRIRIDEEDSNGYTALHYACKKCKVEMCRRLLDFGADVNVRGCDGSSPLIFAVRSYSYSISKLLLLCRADPNVADSNQITPLNVAAANGDTKLCELLLRFGARNCNRLRRSESSLDLSMKNGSMELVRMMWFTMSDHVTVLDWNRAFKHAIEAKNEEACEFLLSRQFDIDATFSNSDSALVAAIQNGMDRTVQGLLRSRIDIDCSNNLHETALGVALNRGQLDLAGALVSCGADVNKLCWGDHTPLMLATMRKWIPFMNTLLEHGADINRTNRWGQSALVIAFVMEWEDVAVYLLNNGAALRFNDAVRLPSIGLTESNISDDESDMTGIDSDVFGALLFAVQRRWNDACRVMLGALHNVASSSSVNDVLLLQAARSNCPELCAELLELGANVNAQSADGFSLLLYAAKGEQAELLHLAVASGADVNVRENVDTMTALHYAVRYDNYDMCKFLLESGADMDPSYEQSVLIFAAEHCCVDIVKLLINYGADVNAREPTEGMTPLLLATKHCRDDVCALLCSNGANVDALSATGFSALHFAAAHGAKADTLRQLLGSGDVINAKAGLRGDMPLLLAGRHANRAAFDFLLRCGAQVNESSSDGTTPLMLAAQNGWVPSIHTLLQLGADVQSRDSNGRSAKNLANCTARQYLKSKKWKKRCRLKR